jgi:hypothetical protein
MIYDTYSETYDVINVYDLENIEYHVDKLKLDNKNKYIRNQVRFYDTNPVDKITYIEGSIELVSGYNITHKPIYYKDFEIKNLTSIYGNVNKIVLDCKIYNTDTYNIYDAEYEILAADFTNVGDDVFFDLENLTTSNERIVDRLE